jgi:hypothetical protein
MRHGLGHLEGDRAVGRDDAAERRDRVARVRLRCASAIVGRRRDAARVGVLDDRDGRVAWSYAARQAASAST